MNTPAHPTPGASPAAGPPSMNTPCWKCGKTIHRPDTFCKHCGQRQAETQAFYYHPVWILLLAFVVLGPFALGLVWRSRVMTPAAKIAMAAIIIAYSALSLYAVYKVGMIEYRQIRELIDLMS